jgi:peptidoglycan/LPS O-acetylase OafA/YrhL
MTTSNPESTPHAERRVDGLNTLRAIAILLVFMYHYMVFVSREPTFGWASTIGWVGVDLFFVLSGYLIANQIFSGIVKGQQLSLKAFYIRRALRTLPNYYVVLALYFLFPVVMGGREPPALWRFLTFTQNYQLPPGTAFSHAWSLCIEEQFYLLLPLLVVLAARFGRSIKLAWALLAIAIAAGIATRSVLWMQYGREAGGAIAGYHPNLYYSSFCRMDEFLPGVAVAMFKNFHRDSWERQLRWGNRTLVVGVAACLTTAWALLNFYEIEDYGYGFFMTAFGYSLVAMCFAILVVAALSPNSLLHRVRVPGAAQLAAWSYAIYLSHKAVAFILQKQLAGYSVASNSLVAVLLISIASAIVGWLLYRAVETPFMNLRDRRFPGSFRETGPSAQRIAVSA